MSSSSDETDYNQQNDVMSEAKSGYSSPSSSSQDDDFIVPPETQSPFTAYYTQQLGNEGITINANALKRRHSSQSTTSSTQDEESIEPPPMKQSLGAYSNTAMRIMASMGYDSQKGLGKAGQGRLEPVEASTQEGRRGFGLKLEGLDAAAVKWSPDLETIQIPEAMDWLKNEHNDLYDITMQDLSEWVVIGNKKMKIDDETRFCEPEILQNVLSSKTVFDQLNGNSMRSARNRCNPFEQIKGGIFLNRAAMKMANMDSLCDFMFTNPVDQQGRSLVKDNDLLYFADVCAGPGGFSEYVLFRKRWEAKGFGFTLREENDFKLDKFHAGPPETFFPYYGVKGDGNVFDPENITSFMDYVRRQTESGVHFVMADGGFDVKGQENIQEILSKQLYLCQCLVALCILREKGHFIVKLFDLFTPFSVGLVYLMYKCFDEICICKPNTSRPANSERYLICKWKKDHTDTIRRHLFQINEEMWSNKNSDVDTIELVRHDILMQDQRFVHFITNSNNKLGTSQIVGLMKIAAYCNDSKLEEKRQSEIRDKCLELWKVPNRTRREMEKVSTDVMLAELLGGWNEKAKLLDIPPKELCSVEDLRKSFTSIYNFHFVPVAREETKRNIRTLFLCKGGRDICIYTPSRSWRELDEVSVQISPRSLFYGEIVTEMIGENRSQSKIHALHIIDAIVLGGKDVRKLPIAERLKMCDKFARSLNKPFVSLPDENQQSLDPIRAKKLFPLIKMNSFFDQMKLYKLKDGKERLGLRIRTDDQRAERFYVPGGLILFNGIYPHLQCHLSKNTNKYYYSNPETHESFYLEGRNPQEVFASFLASYCQRLMWKWTEITQVEECLDESRRTPGILYRTDFFQYLQKILMS